MVVELRLNNVHKALGAMSTIGAGAGVDVAAEAYDGAVPEAMKVFGDGVVFDDGEAVVNAGIEVLEMGAAKELYPVILGT